MMGRIRVALVDVCKDGCDEPGATADAFQKADGVVARQTGGTYPLGEPILWA